MESDFEQQLRQFIANNFLFGVGTELRDTDSFLENGLIDSTGILQLVGYLEEHYGIEVADDELAPENLDSISALTQYLARKLNTSAMAVSESRPEELCP